MTPLATCYPFRPGQAVYYVPHVASHKAQPILHPATVISTRGDRNERVTVLRDDGARRTVKGYYLVYRGYCPSCRVPAIEDDGLRCPRCEQPAVAEPPPDELVLTWYPDSHGTCARAVRDCLLTGCTWGEALTDRRERDYVAWLSMLNQTGLRCEWHSYQPPWDDHRMVSEMQYHAMLGDAQSFTACYEAHGGKRTWDTVFKLAELGLRFAEAIQQRYEDEQSDDLPPSRPVSIPIARPLDDSSPDGEDSVTRWLDQQFRRAA